jgi:hypothetical protein
MKTVREWFELLPEDIKAKALANTAPYRLSREEDSLWNALASSFIWRTSSEKEHYWINAANLKVV